MTYRDVITIGFSRRCSGNLGVQTPVATEFPTTYPSFADDPHPDREASGMGVTRSPQSSPSLLASPPSIRTRQNYRAQQRDVTSTKFEFGGKMLQSPSRAERGTPTDERSARSKHEGTRDQLTEKAAVGRLLRLLEDEPPSQCGK